MSLIFGSADNFTHTFGFCRLEYSDGRLTLSTGRVPVTLDQEYTPRIEGVNARSWIVGLHLNSSTTLYDPHWNSLTLLGSNVLSPRWNEPAVLARFDSIVSPSHREICTFLLSPHTGLFLAAHWQLHDHIPRDLTCLCQTRDDHTQPNRLRPCVVRRMHEALSLRQHHQYVSRHRTIPFRSRSNRIVYGRGFETKLVRLRADVVPRSLWLRGFDGPALMSVVVPQVGRG